MPRKLINYSLVILWMILIFSVSSVPDLPSNNVDVVDFLMKKSAHFLEYTILFFLWYRALGHKNPAQSLVVSLAFAFTDEIHQLFVPGRTGKLTDVAIDFSGILIFALLIVKFDLWKILLSPLPSKRPGK